MQHRASVLAAVVIVLGSAALHATEIRYEDVIYLDEWDQPALHLKTLHRTAVTSSRNPESVTGYLTEGQVVEVIGLGESQYYVSARAATGSARGWVDAQALEAPPAELLAKLRTRRDQAQAHRGLIERHEVAVDMTRREVRASLGKPDRTARLRTEQGDEEQWFYTTYRYLPYYTKDYDDSGRQRQRVSYRREPSGHKVITFRNDQAVEVSDEQEEKLRSPSTTAVPPPRAVN